MSAREAARTSGFTAHADQPLIAVPDEVGGEEIVRYFTSDEDADAATGEQTLRKALAAIGSWKDLDWEETLDELDRIRHESEPTPPVDDL